ncbi:hypothetical protein [Salinadaptatus halalkaliphilus]|uniref:hypothetical protein n=1 Tax=Salinadaptatus halalkaliphilus TaxID=2419781 RepID=UPI001580A128|nr:hypothetical protein [Salinadaptatus halalkaliphilus]
MALDRHAAERRRFARLLGTDGEPGSGLPIGSETTPSDDSRTDDPVPDVDRTEPGRSPP